MSTLQKLHPRKRMVDVKRMTPFTHSMEEFFEDFPPRRWMETFEPFGFRWPMGVDYEKSFRLDLIDTKKELLVRGELPGVERDDIEVTVTGDRLMIEAERQFEEEEEKLAFYRHEVGYGKLVRTIPLPVAVDPQHVIAELKEGILEIRLPKMEQSDSYTVKVA